jgi:hypothetical protein
MTQQDASRNNLTISTMDGRSVPIVSQTEINPMKTGSFPHARARHDNGAHRAPRRGEKAEENWEAKAADGAPTSYGRDRAGQEAVTTRNLVRRLGRIFF